MRKNIFKATPTEILKASITEIQDAMTFSEEGDKKAAYHTVERAIQYLEGWIENYLEENEMKAATVDDIKKAMNK